MTRLTASQYRTLFSEPQKPSKYRAAACWRCCACGAEASQCRCHGCGSTETIRFDSRAEAARWDALRIRERAGGITDLRRQVPFPIELNGSRIGVYRADFVYIEPGGRGLVVEDVKGFDTPLSRFKRHCVEALHRVTIEVIR